MREIKFRAWNKKENIMEQVFSLFLRADGRPFYSDTETPHNEQYVEVMQFTGLKDKNGKEIYVGDIIRSNFTYPRSGTVHEVIECHSGFGVKIGEGTTQYFDAREELEVIGNVYENPELLK